MTTLATDLPVAPDDDRGPDRPYLVAIDPAIWSSARAPRLQLIGGFALSGSTREVPAAGARLVALLALRGALPRSVVVGLLWPESTEPRANGALRTTLWRLGRCAPGLVEGDDMLRLRDDVEVDARRTESGARALLRDRRHRPVDVAALLDGGDLLPGWHDDWVLEERERLRELRVSALEVLALRSTVRRRHALAGQAALAAIRLDPLRETAHRALIRAQLAEGNRVQAIASYQRLADLLRRELGFTPAEETRSLLALDHRQGVRRYSSGA